MLADLDARLADTDAFLARAYPGEDGRRQPVHTVYVPADRYTRPAAAVGDRGRRPRGRARRDGRAVPRSGWRTTGQPVAPAGRGQAGREPIEDLRLDFEDG